MSDRKLMKKYLWLLCSSIIMTILFGYMYLYYYEFAMLIGFTCGLGSTIDLMSITISAYENNKKNRKK